MIKSLPHFWSSKYYFLFYASLAAVIPFLALYYKHLGLSGSESGLLLSVTPLVTLFAAPFWTGLADLSRRYRLVLAVSTAAVVVIMSVFPAFKTTTGLFPAVILFAFFAAPIIPLVDSVTLVALAAQKERYGRIRIWGTIGWGASGPLIGVLLQRYGPEWSFWIYALGMFLALLVGLKLPLSRPRVGVPFYRGLKSLLADQSWVLFLTVVTIAGIGTTVHSNYLAILIEEVGAGKTEVGLALFISTISELPVMFFSYLLLRKIGVRGLFLLAVAAIGLRSLLYLVAITPAGVLAIQLLHGLTYPALWIAGVNFVSENAPPGLGATAQGVFGAALMGIGAATGSALGGLLLDRLGPAGMYGMIGLLVWTGLVLYLLLERRLPGKRYTGSSLQSR